ncbi:hypothetical protein [Niveibacterium sp. SC-1]|uniref:hypothetical protein n=1 Tax=Niveibacterium sp. SC-1 TaxID=3135646 RepID=UPI00311E6801
MLKGVAGFSDVASEGLSLASLPVKKSPLGKFHDWASDSDLEDLVEIDRKYNEGHQMLLMVDFDLVGGEASYMTNELATDSHWVVYEGGLWFSDSNGRPTTHLPSVSTAHFKVYTWGTDPTSGVAIPLPDEVPVQFARTTSFRTNGVPASSWKSNYYGYFAVR